MNSEAVSHPKKVVFVVDDDAGVLFLVNYWFIKHRFIPITFPDAKSMIATLDNVSPDMILLDVRLNSEDGRMVCQHLKEDRKLTAPIVLFSSYPEYLKEDLNQWSASGFIQKGSDYYQMAKELELFF